VENRKSTVRGTNSGMTAVILPSGQVVDPMEPFKRGWKIYDVPVYTEQEHTIYTRHVDILAFLAIYSSIGLLAMGAVLRIIRWRRER
jgi:apolipoprotein N-acyltransferase